MSTHDENDPDYNSGERASEAVGSTTAEISAALSAAVDRAQQGVAAGVGWVRDTYAHNPTRTVTIGLLSLAGLLALITTLTRRN